MAISISSNFLHASIAAEPVSPLVAPSIKEFCLLLLKILSNGYIAGILGAGIAHVLADLIAALIDPSMRPATLGIVIGGLLPLLLIPLLEKVVIKSKHHVVIGDHEDIEKDLKSHHHKD